MAADALRPLLLGCFEAALAAVDARRCVREAVARDCLNGDWHVVAIGKAAGAMTLGAAEALGARMLAALVVTKPGHVPDELESGARVQILESAHPQPDARSLAAGETVAQFVTELPQAANLLFLVSGGASSLIERLANGVTLDELAALNAWALSAGCAIGEVNALRRSVSTMKGGGLAVLAAPRHCRAYLVSDVPRDDPSVIGSGLLHASRAAVDGLPRLPRALAQLVERAAARERSRPVPVVPYRIVASARDACRAAAAHGRAAGWQVRASNHRFAGDAGRLGRRFAGAIVGGAEHTLHVWGGESTIILPPQPGYGGRNQHLALTAAEVLAGHPDAVLLAAGTDGVDGVTADAGAIVDGGTLERGLDAGFEARCGLNGADSGRFLEGSGDLLHTGPTLTNVGDIVIGLRGRIGIE